MKRRNHLNVTQHLREFVQWTFTFEVIPTAFRLAVQLFFDSTRDWYFSDRNFPCPLPTVHATSCLQPFWVKNPFFRNFIFKQRFLIHGSSDHNYFCAVLLFWLCLRETCPPFSVITLNAVMNLQKWRVREIVVTKMRI